VGATRLCIDGGGRLVPGFAAELLSDSSGWGIIEHMFPRLAAAVDELEVPPEPAALAEALLLRDRLTAKVIASLGAFDAEQGWALDHAGSLTAWLRARTGMTGRAAAQLGRVAKLLRHLPVTTAALHDGRLSGGQVEAIAANLTERTVGLFAAHEADLVPLLAPLPTVDVVAAMRVWRQRAEATLHDDEPAAERRELYLSPTLDGRHEGRLSLDAEAGNLLRTALRLAARPDDDDEERSPARRRADALVDIVAHYLDTQRTQRGGRHRPHLNVVVTLEELERRTGGRVADTGDLLPASTVEALLCDCSAHRVVIDGTGTILDYGRATRTVPVNLFNAVLVRDQHCRAPECDVPGERCDAHHVHRWEDLGPTAIDNLVLKCRRHHHLHHRAGWHDELLPDGTYVVTDPSGRVRSTRPPGLLPLAA
jgi:hypothetical protein